MSIETSIDGLAAAIRDLAAAYAAAHRPAAAALPVAPAVEPAPAPQPMTLDSLLAEQAAARAAQLPPADAALAAHVPAKRGRGRPRKLVEPPVTEPAGLIDEPADEQPAVEAQPEPVAAPEPVSEAIPAAPAAEPVAAPPEAVATPAPAVDAAPAPKAPVVPIAPAGVTVEQTRAVLREVALAGKREGVKALLREFGAEELSQVPAARLPEMIERARAL